MRIGIDTNVLVRAFVDDGTAQHRAVGKLMRDHHVIISPSVLLEAEWVLSDTYELSRLQIAQAFEALIDATSVNILKYDAVARALEQFRAGFDFADVLHLALTSEIEAFATFDKRFARRAAKLGLRPTVLLASTLS